MAQIYHITTLQEWQDALHTGVYRPVSLAVEGFIHASTRDQLPGTAERYYRSKSGLILLEIDEELLKPEVRYEPSDHGDLYPHIYGEINLDAVDSAIPFDPGNPPDRA